MMFYYMDKKTGDDLKEKAKKAIIEIIKKCSNLSNLEPLLHVTDLDILYPILNQYVTYLQNNQTELSNFARNGGLNKILSINNFKTQNVTNMESMFLNCTNLVSLDINLFDVSKVENMKSMFENCNLLYDLKINFGYSPVTNLNSMFSECNLLSELDIFCSNF